MKMEYKVLEAQFDATDDYDYLVIGKDGVLREYRERYMGTSPRKYEVGDEISHLPIAKNARKRLEAVRKFAQAELSINPNSGKKMAKCNKIDKMLSMLAA